MCIRDRIIIDGQNIYDPSVDVVELRKRIGMIFQKSNPFPKSCLLYTSDAADERSSVDLGGRRIIKKKKYDTVHADPECNPIMKLDHHIINLHLSNTRADDRASRNNAQRI